MEPVIIVYKVDTLDISSVVMCDHDSQVHAFKTEDQGYSRIIISKKDYQKLKDVEALKTFIQKAKT